MSLDIMLSVVGPTVVHWQNITHNLGKMADAAGVYRHLWHPEDLAINLAFQLIGSLETAIADMENNPDYYRQYDAKNGWGTYDDFLPWLKKLLEACKENPNASIRVSR